MCSQCLEKMTKCNDCKELIEDESDVSTCVGCNNELCYNCGRECEHCGDFYCHECLNDHEDKCQENDDER